MLKLKALLLTQGMHGMISQVEGLSKALNLSFKHQTIRLKPFWNLIPPKFTPISENLINSGINNTLVQLGEYRGIGDHPDGRPWRLLLSNPEHTDTIGEIEFTNAAVATSAGLGTPFDLYGKYHHIFDPKNGYNANKLLQVSVIAKTAAEADALATAFLVLDQKAAEKIARKLNVGFEIFDNSRNRKIITSI